MNLIAIDFVILPNPVLIETAILLNKIFCDDRISLGFRMAPHISLLMEFVDKKNITKILNELNHIIEELKNNSLSYETQECTLVDVGLDRPILSWNILKTNLLLDIQNILIQKFKFYNIDVIYSIQTSQAFYGGASERTFQWTKRYLEYSVAQNFEPHITIGFLKDDKDKESVIQKANEIVQPHKNKTYPIEKIFLFQLGDFCTCRQNFKMPIPQKLYQKYLQAEYFVLKDIIINELSDYRQDTTHLFNHKTLNKIQIQINQFNPILDEFVLQYPYSEWCFLTAVNPGSKILPYKENYQRNRMLLQFLKEEQCIVMAGYSKEAHSHLHSTYFEESFLVLGLNLKKAIQLTGFFGQNAFLYSKIHEPAKLIENPIANPF